MEIQASESGSICQFFQIHACFDCVVINHQKGGDCKQHGPIRPLFEILVIQLQHDHGTNNFVKRIFLCPKDEVKRPSKAKHEERTH